MEVRRRLPATVPWLLVLLLATSPLWGVGFPRGHDWLFELVRVREAGAALAEGPIPPAWAPDLYSGFGSPIFLFYAPLFPVVAWALSTLTGSVLSGAVAALGMAALVGMVGMAALGVCTAPGAGAPGSPERVGAALFLLHPYVLSDLAIRNASAEYLALMLLPFALGGAVLCRRGSRRGLPVLALGSAAVILSHNLSALVMAVLLLIITLGWARHRRVLARLVPGGALGLGLSAWFWLPALVLLPRMRTAELTGGKFRTAENLPGWSELLGAGHRSVGWLTLVVGIVGFAVLLRSGQEREKGLLPRGAVASSAAALLFLVTPASRLLWREVEILGILQFPWRLIGPLALLVAWIGTEAFRRVVEDWAVGGRRLAEAGVILLAVLQAVPVLGRIRPLEPEVRREAATIFGRQSIRSRGLPATVGDEYLPRGADRSVMQSAGEDVLLEWDGPRPVPEVLEARGAEIALRSRASASGTASLARWYFPGWAARSGTGDPVAVARGPAGALRVEIPGRTEVRVEYRSPGIRILGLWISAIAGVLLLFGGAVVRRVEDRGRNR